MNGTEALIIAIGVLYFYITISVYLLRESDEHLLDINKIQSERISALEQLLTDYRELLEQKCKEDRIRMN